MVRRSEDSLVPRNGHTLIAGIVARISGGPTQKDVSLDDQVDHAKEEIGYVYTGPIEYRIIATTGKGERLDRPELAEVETAIRSGELDLLVIEDLGRLVRGTFAKDLLGIAVDHGIRAIVPNDCIDTAEETWEEDAIAACRDHVGANAHTSKRLKHKLMNRFRKFGGATALPIAGYIVPDDARTYDDWKKDPDAEQWINAGAKMLRETLNCSAVADLFNRLQVPVGPYCRRTRWNGAMVRRFFGSPILKGLLERGATHTVKHHESGQRRSMPNPNGPTVYEAPHLAFLSVDEFDDLNAALDDHNDKFARKSVNGHDPRAIVPRKRTRFPGQHAQCWYCGRHFVWGGNGITGHLMCNGSRDWSCWNSVGFDGSLAVREVVAAITAELYLLDGFDEQFRELLEIARDRSDDVQRWERLERDQRALEAKRVNVQATIAELGPVPLVTDLLKDVESTARRLRTERMALERVSQCQLQLPASPAELRTVLEQKFAQGAHDSPEFGDLLRNLVVDFRVHLVRMCDGGHLLPRARVRLALGGIVPDAALVPGLSELLSRELTLDLFEPPQRERIRPQAVALAAQGLGHRTIAQRIDERPAAAAVQSALALNGMMRQMGLTTPYVLVTEPPENYGKLRRHRNAKYHFTPLDGYTPPTL